MINDWLLEMHVGCMPDGALYDAQFHGLSAEVVYDRSFSKQDGMESCARATFYMAKADKEQTASRMTFIAAPCSEVSNTMKAAIADFCRPG